MVCFCSAQSCCLVKFDIYSFRVWIFFLSLGGIKVQRGHPASSLPPAACWLPCPAFPSDLQQCLFIVTWLRSGACRDPRTAGAARVSLPPEAPGLRQPAGCLLETAACLPLARPHSEPCGHCPTSPFTCSSVSCTNWELDLEASSDCCCSSVVTPWNAARQASLSITNSRSLLKLTSIVGDAIQPSHPLLLPSPPAFNLSQHQSLFQ